jgi:uncharacterized protein YjbJ (UPF0337 family)
LPAAGDAHIVVAMGFLDKVLGRAKEAAGSAAEKAGPALDTAQDAAGDAWDKTKDVAGDAADRARETLGKAGEEVEGTASEAVTPATEGAEADPDPGPAAA